MSSEAPRIRFSPKGILLGHTRLRLEVRKPEPTTSRVSLCPGELRASNQRRLGSHPDSQIDYYYTSIIVIVMLLSWLLLCLTLIPLLSDFGVERTDCVLRFCELGLGPSCIRNIEGLGVKPS